MEITAFERPSATRTIDEVKISLVNVLVRLYEPRSVPAVIEVLA